MLTHTLLMFALLMSPDIDPRPQYQAWIQDHEVWVETSSGDRRVRYDAAASYPIAPSPSGDQVAYAVPDGKPVPEGLRSTMLIEIMGADGRALAKFPPEDGYLDGIEWIDNDRIGVVTAGHANCVYWVVDAHTGQTLQKFWGGFDFLWSHDRRYVTRRHMGRISMDGRI